MFDAHHGIPRLYQAVQNIDELMHIGHMQARCGLVQHIYGGAGAALGKLGGKLDPLGLAAGEGGAGLAQLHIAKTHILQRLDLPADLGQVLKEHAGLVNGHVQHVGNALALVFHLKGLPVVALAVANIAGNKDIGQKVHLDLDQAVAAAGLAAAALGVEGEAAGGIASELCVPGGGVQVPDVVEYAGVGGGVGPWRSADGALVQGDNLVHIFKALDPGAFSRARFCPVLFRRQGFIQNLVDQGGFSAAGHAGDADQLSQRNLHIDIFQVVFRGAPDHEALSAAFPAPFRHRDKAFPAEILAGHGFRTGTDILDRPGRHHIAAVYPGARADVNHIVRGAHGVLVVLHHNQGVAQIPEIFQGREQLVVVPLVQADAGLV